jgi:4-hydroxybutyryl-CoA dehydratase/vinylacetyl-CoA-Delta-isomerase
MLRTVEEYISSLKDGRVVYYNGKRVDDVTTHPALKVAVKHASDIFVLQNNEK